MIVYILMIIILFIVAILSKKYKNGTRIFLIFSLILLTVISGLRNYKVGVDTEMYVKYFLNITNVSFEYLKNFRYEYGFSIFFKCLSMISDNYHFLLFIVSLIVNYSVIRFIKLNSKNIYLSVILYILCNFFFSYMNIMRQAIAISIVLFGYEELKKNNVFKYSIYVLIASQFHISSIICLLLIVIKNKKISKKSIPYLLVMLGFVFFFGEKIFEIICELSPRFSMYASTEYSNKNFSAAFLETLVIGTQFMIGLMTINTQKENNKDDNANKIVLTNAMLIALSISILSMKATIFTRFYAYFAIFSIIWTPNFIKEFISKKKQFVFSIILIILFILYFIIINVFRPEWYGVIPYIFLD